MHPFILTRQIWKDDYDGQMIFGVLVGLKLLDIYLTGEEKPRKKPHPGNLSLPGIEHGLGAWQARMLPPASQRWTNYSYYKINKNILNSCPTQGRVEGWDAMKPLYYRSVSSKGAGRPRLTHHHKGWWNETKWMRWVWRNGVWNLWQEKMGKIPRKTQFGSFHHETRNLHGLTETRTRDPSGVRRVSNNLCHGEAK